MKKRRFTRYCQRGIKRNRPLSGTLQERHKRQRPRVSVIDCFVVKLVRIARPLQSHATATPNSCRLVL